MDRKFIEDYYIRLYFKVSDNDYITAAIKRAYRDFSRTIRFSKLDNESKSIWKHTLENILKTKLNEVLNQQFESQRQFDDWHNKVCNRLILKSKNDFLELKYGQAQKWVNMALKYLYTLSDSRVLGISTNYKYFHLPIDIFIQKKLKKQYNIEPLKQNWSRIDFPEYLNYQERVREKIRGEIVMDVEFKLFNET